MDRTPSRPPTIIDLARATGLSKSVVSRALNDEPGVSRASREAVLEAAARMGYVANAMARRMRSRRVDTVGVLVRDPASPFYGALLGAIQGEASGRGIRLLAMTGSGRPHLDEERAALRSLLALRVDGLLVCSGLLPASDLYPFAERVPTVIVGRRESDARISSVSCDDEDGTTKLVEHVLDTGLQRLIVPVPPAAEAPALHVRANLFVARAHALGAAPTIVPASSPAEALDRIGPAQLGPAALLAPNDRWAVAFREALAGTPGLIVTGYDGVGVYTSPLLGLTTLVQPIREIAATALDLVIGILTEQRSPEHRSIPGRLHVPAR